MSERRPFPENFHPNGMLFLSAMGIIGGTVDILVLHHAWLNYVYVAPWVLMCQLVQLYFDYRASDWWYRTLTSPPYQLTLKQLFAQRWKSLVSFLAVPFFGLLPTMALFLATTGLYYFWQRLLYDRSVREFGPGASKAEADE